MYLKLTNFHHMKIKTNKKKSWDFFKTFVKKKSRVEIMFFYKNSIENLQGKRKERTRISERNARQPHLSD